MSEATAEDVVERLRLFGKWAPAGALITEAATLIEQQAARIAELRGLVGECRDSVIADQVWADAHGQREAVGDLQELIERIDATQEADDGQAE